jgi:hypothetical protein
LKKLTLTLFYLILVNVSFSQQAVDSSLVKAPTVDDHKTFNFHHMEQLWSVFTYNAFDKNGQSVDNRANIYLRRARFGADGSLNKKINYTIWFAFDNIGKDQYSGTFGQAQAPSNSSFYLWDAILTYKLHPKFLNITGGYFRPQVGRENMISAFQVNSLDKALTNFYTRPHLVGRSSGREAGFNIGGLYNKSKWGLNYNFGVFNPNHESIAGVANGAAYWSPLLTGRMAFSFGAPEMENYGISYKLNQFGARKGITIGFNFTRQNGTTETWDFVSNKYTGGFKRNSLYGVDVVLNYANLTIDAEYDEMYRAFSDSLYAHHKSKMAGSSYQDRVWHVRAGYNFKAFKNSHIESCIMYSFFEGSNTSVYYGGGRDRVLDFGINYYINKNNLKLNLHYVVSGGSSKSMYSSALGKEQRGDILVFGLQYIY